MLRLCLFLVVGFFVVGFAAAQQPDQRAFADLLKLPSEPPAVDATTHGSEQQGGLSLEDVSWESLDGERAPAFVIRPSEATGRLPAVICLHGSSGSRESMTTEQFGPGEWVRHGSDQPHHRMLGWARELARRGYVTLSLTQRGLDRRGPAINTQSNALLAQGRTGMGAVLHEIRQALTYLQSRPDVDPDRIAATGMSFGGITSFYLWIVDDRLAAAAPICGGVGSVETFIEQGRLGYHGTYWWLPGMVPLGDQAAFAVPRAPKPLMLWAPTEDVGMPRDGVDRLLADLRPAYARAGKPDALVVHQRPGEHEFSLEAFDALVAFLDKFL